MSMLEVLIPMATTRITERPLAPRLAQLNGARIGWLDNMKANAGELLSFVIETLQARNFAFAIEHASKNPTAAAPASVMAHLKTCDAVVLAIAD